MRDIEKLFAQELEIMEARTVHPEYGFTEESMLEHITSPADATVASLLVYGAKRGSCTVGVRPEQQEITPRPTQRPKGLSIYNTPTPEEPVTTQPESTTTPEPQNPVLDIDDTELQPKKSSLGEKIRILFTKAGNTFIGEGEEGEF
jgi:hypothetical protein